MIKYLFVLIVLNVFIPAFFLYSDEDAKTNIIELPLITISASAAIVPGSFSDPYTLLIPEEIVSSSSINKVMFPHLFRYEDLEYECGEYHHEINAANLITPHDTYFKDFGIDCSIYHNGNETAKKEAKSCSECLHTHPYGSADETLSAKVVIDKNCWQCHEV